MTTPTHAAATESLAAAGLDLEVIRRGAGAPILVLHGFDTIAADAPFLDLLARQGEVIAPSHPGFGHSPRPDDFETVYDLVQLYLDVIERLGDRVALIGLGFGGWLAAEIAVACGHRLDRLVLVDAVGIKVGDRETADVLDVFNTSPDEVARRTWHDARRAPDWNEMTDDQMVVRARNWETLCLYTWHPYMYNPRLRFWLKKIATPTLVLWGGSDRVVTPDYGRAYAAEIPGARFEVIDGAGHHPEIEQPEAFAAAVAALPGRARRGAERG